MSNSSDLYNILYEFDSCISRSASREVVSEALQFFDNRFVGLKVSLALPLRDGRTVEYLVLEQDHKNPPEGVSPVCPLETTHICEVLRHRKPIYRPDIASYRPEYPFDEPMLRWGMKSDFAVPLVIEDRAIGTFNCGAFVKDGVDEDTRRLLTLAAPPLAFALHVTGLLEETQLNEQKYRNIFDNTTAAVYSFDRDKKFIDTNPAGVELLGYSREELLGMHISEVDADPKVVLPAHRQLMNGENLVNYEHQLRRKDGSVVTVLNNSISLRDREGCPVGMQSYLFDITSCRRAEEAERIKQELSEKALQITGLDKAVKLCTDTACTVSGMELGGLYIINSLSGDLELQYATGLMEDQLEEVTIYRSRSLNASIVTSGKVILASGSELSVLLPDSFREAGINSGAIVPFNLRDRLGGCITLVSSNEIGDGQALRQQLESFSDQVSTILTRVQISDQLRKSEASYQNLFESTSDGILIAELDSVISEANDAAALMLGYKSRDELIGSDMKKHFADPDEIRYLWDQLFEKSTITNYELHPVRSDGTVISVLASGTMLRSKRGKPVRGSLLFTDVTERVDAEEALRISEEKYRTVADFTYDWEYWVSKDGSLRYVSPSVERITGYSPDEFIEDPEMMLKIVHPDDRDRVSKHKHCINTEGKSEPMLFRIISREGETRWISHYCQPVISNRGENLGRRGSNRDVTDQIETEQALRESEKRFSSLVKQLPQAVVEVDTDGKVRFMNARGFEMLGYSHNDVNRLDSMLDFVIPEEREKIMSRFGLLFQGKDLGGIEYTGLRQDGSTFPVMVYANVIYENGRATGVRSIVIDLSAENDVDKSINQKTGDSDDRHS